MTAPAGPGAIASITTEEIEAQRRVVLTAHPLQRVGAFALTALAGCREPGEITADAFDTAVRTMADDAVRAAHAESTKAADGFWLKASGSFFPNSKMNHPSRSKRGRDELTEQVRAWRTMPEARTWPGVPCALCGRAAVSFFGKVDVPLMESENQRNTTAPGQAGLPLCWPCVSCFHALPYGCRLTGGANTAVHSWDDSFLAQATRERVRRNNEHIALGVPVPSNQPSADQIALRGLREHGRPLGAGVDLFVFNNDNRGASLAVHAMDQPLAEWLRRTMRASNRAGYTALVAAHRTKELSGETRLAHHAFRQPSRILRTAAAYLADRPPPADPVRDLDRDLAALCFSFAKEVLYVEQRDVDEIRALARNVATVVAARKTQSELKKFQVAYRDQNPARLRKWIDDHAVRWMLRSADLPTDATGPFITVPQTRLLFDPDHQTRLHRQLLLVAVLEHLHEMGWHPEAAEGADDELDDETITSTADETGDLDAYDITGIGSLEGQSA
ncbi:hypothetical protein [Protofrankia coriariae]|uniref:hypothetical protein n=1 Tax=Protofrankia coriariae TaxID=1562887 RepID=UPI0012F7033D|nr:hypothetical protein [Protofrankia coriariae]